MSTCKNNKSFEVQVVKSPCSTQKCLPVIVSMTNERIKLVAKLVDGKERAVHGLFVAQGHRICMTLMQSGVTLDRLYLTEKAYEQADASMRQNNKITIVSERVMEKMHLAVSPSGVVGVFKIPVQPDLNEMSSGVVLDGISDPGNMGTLIRASVAMNRTNMVVIGGVDPWNPKVVQASAGYIGFVKFFRCDWPTLLSIKKQQKLRLIALVAAGGRTPGQVSFKNSLLVVGNEAHGIDKQWVASCDERLTLPMPGNTESLNAAIAGAIALYAAFVVRQ